MSSAPLGTALGAAGVPLPRQAPEPGLRVALVHERFTDWAGSEKVVEQMARLWPEASIHTAICDRQTLSDSMRQREIVTSGLQKVFDRVGRYEYLLPALPRTFSRMTLPEPVDLVVVSHHAFANRIQVPAGTGVLSYVYSPARWMWEPSTGSLERGPWALRHGLGLWSRRQLAGDREAARRIDTHVAISRHIQARIARCWGIESEILHPPVDTGFYTRTEQPREDFFLLAGRLVPYKRPDVAIRAAHEAGVRLVVAGDGRMFGDLQQFAGEQIKFLGRVSDETLRDLYRRCAALVFPGEEDFGIVMAEAQSCGAPVIARGVGGAVDIVNPSITGVLYEVPGDEDRQQVAALRSAMAEFSHHRFDSAAIARLAARFSQQNFRSGLAAVAQRAYARGSSTSAAPTTTGSLRS